MAKRKPKKKPGEALVEMAPTLENQLKIVPILEGYFQEADQARKSGLNPRDEKWEENTHLYWNRTDFSRKASWQARVQLPEVPTFVDRFGAALKEALVASPTGFYTVNDPADREHDLGDAIKRALDVWLSVCGRNQTGTCLSFPAVFEEQCKLGAIKACCSVTTWKNDIPGGRVAIETVDPSNVWLDPTNKNLYRIRRVELDKHTLREMATSRDGKGNPLWNLDAIEQMVSHIEDEDLRRREELTGTAMGQKISTREPVVMDEYIGTVIDGSGNVLAKDALMVVGNRQFLIRGPEPNPFWHKKDWMVFAPLVTVPLSVYGRSYMEDFGSVATAFNTLTNMLLDAVHTSSLKAFAVVPEMLLNPEQLNEGITPNKTFLLDGSQRAEDFMKAIDLGTLPAEAFSIWQAFKSELREAADLNEVGLGQFAPKGRTSATEISQTQESSSALIRSVAQTLETRFLNPTLDIAWKTGLQHVSRDNVAIRAAVGAEMWDALHANRKELIARPITFQAMGISMLIQKNRMLRSLMQLMQIMSQSDLLLQEFLKVADMGKFMKLLFHLSDIDLSKLVPTERERLIASFGQPMQQAGNESVMRNRRGTSQPAGGGVQREAQDIAQTLGVQR